MGSSPAPVPPPTVLPGDLPRSLVFFRPGTPTAFRRRRLIGVLLFSLAGAAVIWPIYPLFAGATPRILGLPLALVWVVVALLVVFITLLWLFRHEEG